MIFPKRDKHVHVCVTKTFAQKHTTTLGNAYQANWLQELFSRYLCDMRNVVRYRPSPTYYIYGMRTSMFSELIRRSLNILIAFTTGTRKRFMFLHDIVSI